VHCGKNVSLDDWLADLPSRARDRHAGARLVSTLNGLSCPTAIPVRRACSSSSHARVRGERVELDRAPRARRVSPEERRGRHSREPRKTGGPAAKHAHVHCTSAAISTRWAIICTRATAR